MGSILLILGFVLIAMARGPIVSGIGAAVIVAALFVLLRSKKQVVQ